MGHEIMANVGLVADFKHNVLGCNGDMVPIKYKVWYNINPNLYKCYMIQLLMKNSYPASTK